MIARRKVQNPILLAVAVLCWLQMLTVKQVEGCLCHVIPNFVCPPPPHCCESGQYAKDECGCCLTCAKAELQPCGGPNGEAGHCSSGLQCLKTCSKNHTLLASAHNPCIMNEGMLRFFQWCEASVTSRFDTGASNFDV